jgi:hypothetical protein
MVEEVFDDREVPALEEGGFYLGLGTVFSRMRIILLSRRIMVMEEGLEVR